MGQSSSNLSYKEIVLLNNKLNNFIKYRCSYQKNEKIFLNIFARYFLNYLGLYSDTTNIYISIKEEDLVKFIISYFNLTSKDKYIRNIKLNFI